LLLFLDVIWKLIKNVEMSKYAKLTTNLTGLAVAKTPVNTLGSLYGRCLRALAKMPADYPYRKHTEQIVTERAAMVKAATTIEDLEKKLDCGQVEEVIIQAENEVALARMLLETRAWEPLVNEPPANQWKWPM